MLAALLLTTLLCGAAATKFQCDQTVTPCKCFPDPRGDFTDAKDCAYECCPTYDCNQGECTPDQAGGYPFEHCAGSCSQQITGYDCDPASMKCVGSLSAETHATKEYCETECGVAGGSSVVLCAYTCGSDDAEYTFQSCIANPDGAGAVPECPGSGASQLQTSHTDAACCEHAKFCMQHLQSKWPCCDPGDEWDSANIMCWSPAAPPPPPQMCPDGTPAHFKFGYPMRGGLEMCMKYDCTWGAELCGLTDCTSGPTPKGPACAATSKSVSKNYMGIAELTPPAMDGRSIKHTVRWRNAHGHHLNLTYDALLTEEQIFLLDSETGVRAVNCSDEGTLTIALDPFARGAVASELQSATFVTGGHQWGCLFRTHAEAHPSRVIVRRIIDVVISGDNVKVRSSKADYADLFARASLSFSTNYLPNAQHFHPGSSNPSHRRLFEEQRVVYEKARAAEAKNMAHRDTRQLGFWHSIGSFLSRAWHAVRDLAKLVAKAAAAVVKVVVAIVTGDYHYDHDLSLASIQWNYDESSKSAKQPDIALNGDTVCSECYVNMDVSVHVNLAIETYSLKHSAIYLQGQVAMHINASANVQPGDDVNFDVLIHTLKLPNVDFFIGVVPFVIQTTVPIHAIGDLSANSGGGKVQALAHLDGDIKHGVQYTPENGFQYINTHSFTHYGGLSGSHIELSAVATVAIMPVVVINIDHIGGPQIGFKGFVTTSVDHKEDGSMCSVTGGTGTSYTTAWGLQLTLGAHLDIEFVGHVFVNKSTDNEPVWSHQWPLGAGCLDLPSSMQHADSTGYVSPPQMQERNDDDILDFFEGVQYIGDIVTKTDPSCNRQVSIRGGLQFVNQSESGFPGWVGITANNNGKPSATHDFTQDFNVMCVGQHYYIAQGPRMVHYLQPSLEPDVAYINCTLNALGNESVTLADLQGSWSFSADLSTLSLTPDDPCIIPMALKREEKACGTLPRAASSKPDLVSDGHPLSPAIAWERWTEAARLPQLTSAEATALLNGKKPKTALLR